MVSGVTLDEVNHIFKENKNKHNILFNLKQEQLKLAWSVLNGQDIVGVLPTGFGKTLCFVVPTVIWQSQGRKPITLVISPLKSLMQDQLEGLADWNFTSCRISGKDETPSEVMEGKHFQNR